MSTEENKDIARRWVDEVWGKQDLSAIEDLKYAGCRECGNRTFEQRRR